MTAELTALTLAALLQMVQFLLFAVPANHELGPRYTAGPRDTPPKRSLSPRTARLQRALNNHFEGLILFGIAATVTTVAGQSTALTAACGWVYLAARVLRWIEQRRVGPHELGQGYAMHAGHLLRRREQLRRPAPPHDHRRDHET